MEYVFHVDFWKFVFEDMFMNGIASAIFNSIGILSLILGITLPLWWLLKTNR
jgi:hypothetical protein